MRRADEINHEYFEELGALAALGQISAEEFQELRSHLGDCSMCRSNQAEFIKILHEHLPLLAGHTETVVGPEGARWSKASVRERFLARAASEGVQFSDEVLGKTSGKESSHRGWFETFSWAWQPPRYAVALTLLFVFSVFGWMGVRIQQTTSKYAAASAEMARLSAEVDRLNTAAAATSSLVSIKSAPSPSLPVATSEMKGPTGPDRLQMELTTVRRDYENAVIRVHYLDAQLQKATSELTTLKSDLVLAQAKVQNSEKLRETEVALRQANEELTRLKQDRSIQVANMSAQLAQIKELTDKLYAQRESLDLLATTQEIRELMGARNLHIIDVADVDIRGTRKPFGRVFYTEGKSLVFYAYDLEKRKKSMEKFCFQAWGQIESRTGSVQSLGVFSSDDQQQNRWVLKNDDPSVLAMIDSVFVTVEPVGGSIRPRGQQLMYAYLKANPNHP